MSMSVSALSNHTVGVGEPIYTLTFKLIDNKYSKIIKIDCTEKEYISDVFICNEILNIIYNEYRYSKECVFSNIKYLFNKKYISLLKSSNIKDTIFYKIHKKNMNSFLDPVKNFYNSYITFGGTNNLQWSNNTSATISTTTYWSAGQSYATGTFIYGNNQGTGRLR